MALSDGAGLASQPPGQASTVYDEVHRLHRSLSNLQTASNPSSLHPLDDDVARRTGYTSNGSSSKEALSRQDFTNSVSSLRSTLDLFRRQKQRLASQPELGSGPSTASTSAAPSAEDVKKMVFSLREKSQHLAQLQSTRDPLQMLLKEIAAKTKRPPLSDRLLTGGLASSSSSSNGKRRREDDSYICGSAIWAVELLGALSLSLEDLAKSLGLETFAEAVAGAAEAASGGSIHTHTLTQGGRLLVLDLELGFEPSKKSAGPLEPFVRLKVSLASEATSTQPRSLGTRSQLADLLKADVEALAKLLFGLGPTSRQGDPSELVMSTAERRLRLATSHFNRLKANLTTLVELDRLSSLESSPVDLFTAIDELSSAVREIAQAQSKALNEAGISQAGTSRKGHGIPLMHAGRPGVRLVYHSDGRSSTEIEADVQRSSLDTDKLQPTTLRSVSIAPGPWTGRNRPSIELPQSDMILPELLQKQLVLQDHDGLAYLTHLSPPQLLPRFLAARLASIVGLDGLAGLSTLQDARDQSSGNDYTALLLRDIAVDSSIFRFADKPSSYPEDQGLAISFFPFKTLLQLYAATEILREASVIAHLVSLCGTAPASTLTRGPLPNFDVSIRTGVEGNAILFAVRLIVDSAMHSADWVLQIALSRAPSGSLSSYSVQVQLVDELGSLLDPDTPAATKTIDTSTAKRLATLLEGDDLTSTLGEAVHWARKTVGLDPETPPQQPTPRDDAMEVDDPQGEDGFVNASSSSDTKLDNLSNAPPSSDMAGPAPPTHIQSDTSSSYSSASSKMLPDAAEVKIGLPPSSPSSTKATKGKRNGSNSPIEAAEARVSPTRMTRSGTAKASSPERSTGKSGSPERTSPMVTRRRSSGHG